MSANFDLHSKIFNVIAIENDNNPAETTVGNIVDTNLAYALEFVINSGGLAIAGTVTFIMEHGDDPTLSDATPVPTDDILGTLSAAQLTSTSPETKRVGYVGKKRFVRMGYTSTQAGIYGALAIKYIFRSESTPNN